MFNKTVTLALAAISTEAVELRQLQENMAIELVQAETTEYNIGCYLTGPDPFFCPTYCTDDPVGGKFWEECRK